MTLVVSEISKHGVVMIGDSAVTYSKGGKPEGVRDGAAKVQYSEKVNVGFAIWGNAVVQGYQMDEWIRTFIKTKINNREEIESVGQRLASELRSELKKENKPWSELVFGIHLAGYINNLPRLWHIHCGHSHETPHEPRLYHDYPEDQNWSEDYFRTLFFSPGAGAASAHLRNGYTPHYALLFSSMKDYVNGLRQQLNINLPTDSLEGHLDFHKLLVRFVAGSLVSAGEHPGVNDNLSSISFDKNGIVTDDRFPIIDWLNNPSGVFSSGSHMWL